MSRPTYAPKQTYVGTGSKLDYTFDFKIEALLQLLVIELDDSNVETQRVRGDDVTYIDTVDFDAVDGAGTVNLLANLPTNYTLVILLANDAPTQPFEFKNKGAFTQKRIENALDFVVGAVQRLAYRGKQALRIHDSDDEEAFDAQFPPGVATELGSYLKVNDAGDGFEYGVTLAELQAAILPDGTVTGEVLTWDGAAWIASLSGGAKVVSSSQNISSGGKITPNTGRQQLLKVQGDSGPQTTSIAPFVSAPVSGTTIILVGESAVNVLKIPYSNTDEGCLLKGDAYLGLNDTLTLVYDLATKRYLEQSRN